MARTTPGAPTVSYDAFKGYSRAPTSVLPAVPAPQLGFNANVANPDPSVPVPAAANPFLGGVQAGMMPAAAVPAAVSASTVTPVFAAAEAYRNLPPGATSTDKQAAMSNYAIALRQQREAAAPNPLVKYNAHLGRQGINPDRIGTAVLDHSAAANPLLSASGGMIVPSPFEETEATDSVNLANRQLGELNSARREYAHGIGKDRRGKDPEKERYFRQEAAELQRDSGAGKFERARDIALDRLRAKAAQRAEMERAEISSRLARGVY